MRILEMFFFRSTSIKQYRIKDINLKRNGTNIHLLDAYSNLKNGE